MFVAVYDTCVGVIPTDASLEQKASGGRITTHTLRVVQSEIGRLISPGVRVPAALAS